MEYLSVSRGKMLWLSSQVIEAGGLEVTWQENLASEPAVTITGTGCTTKGEMSGTQWGKTE